MSAKLKPISGLTRRLIQDGFIELEDAEKYSVEANKARQPLVAYLVKRKLFPLRPLQRPRPVNSAPP